MAEAATVVLNNKKSQATSIRAQKPPNTLVIRSAEHGGVRYEYVENPKGRRAFNLQDKKRYFVMQEDNAKDKDHHPSELIAMTVPQAIDFKLLPRTLFSALYEWDSWARLFGYRVSKSEKIAQVIKLVIILVLSMAFIYLLSTGKK